MSKSPKSTAKSVKAITTKKVGDVIVNRGKGLKEPKFVKAASYNLTSTIEDSMKGAATSGKAGAGQIVAVFASKYFAHKKHPQSGRPYYPVEDYFKAPSTDEYDDTSKKVIKQSRKTIQDNFLALNSATYKKTLAEYLTLTAKLNDAQKEKNAYDVSDYTFRLVEPTTKILAARGMLHRTITALAYLYDIHAQSVQFGLNNAIKIDCIPNKDGSKNKSTGLNKASDIVSKGNKYLIEKKWVAVRGTQAPPAATNGNDAVTQITPPAVDAKTATTVMASLTKLFTSDKFNPPVTASGKTADITVDKNKQAEFALTCIGDIKPQDLRSNTLRSTIAQIAVDCAALLKIKMVSDAQKMLNEATLNEKAA
jgi:hypothetical protein